MISTVIRTAIMYLFVTLGIRLMGKRQIGDMQPNELVVTLLISEIAAIPLQDTSQPVLNGIIAIFMLVIIEIIISVLSMKNIYIRKLLSGKSVVIIKNGEVDQSAMKKVRMTVLDLIELLRGQNVFDISNVAYAVLEVNGNLSVLLKGEQKTVTNKDMNIKTEKAGLQIPVISDGKLIKESLAELEIKESELLGILKSRKKSLNDVFLMTMDRYKKYNIIEKRINNA